MRDTKKRREPASKGCVPAGGVVRVGPLAGIPEALCEFDLEPGQIFESAGLDLTQFAQADSEIPYIAASRLLARCAEITGCRHFGLLVGERAASSALGIAGFMLRCAPDIGTALRGLLQHFDLHDQGGVPTLLIKGDVTLLGYAIHQSRVEAADQIYDLAIAIACNIMRGLCGEHWNPTEVLFSCRHPQNLAPYRSFFRAPFHFNAGQNAVVFPTHWLDEEIPTADLLLYRYLEREAVNLHGARVTNSIGELRGLLRKSLAARNCTAGEIARQLCIHERTLNRRLRVQGTSFRRELDNTRQQMALHLLADSTMPLARIASLLNYTGVSAFSRAFRRWTGSTPARWRADNRL